MSPLVSVILPVYNNEKTIGAAVSSILNQSFTDFELIIVNDGSVDGTQAVLKAYDDPRIVIIGDVNNQGLPRRLNQALALSRGTYIARMDADDLALPERLARQVAFLETHKDVDLLAARAVVFGDGGEIVGLLPYAGSHDEIARHPWNSFPMPHPTWMARRDWILKYGYAVPEVWRAEDQDLLLRAYLSSRFACLPDILLCYRQGAFNFKKTAIARRNLLRAQLSFFFENKLYLYALLSLGGFCIKTSFDVLQLCPLFAQFYVHKKLGVEIPAESLAVIKQTLGRA